MSAGLIVIGASWGGLEATGQLLARLAPPLPVPVLVVLHRHRRSGSGALAQLLARLCDHHVHEAEDKEVLRPATVYLAPPDYHVLVEGGGVSLSVEGPVNYSRPSVDLAFESAAMDYAERLIAVVLTGAGRDGAGGLATVRRRGGRILVQDPQDAERPDMPLAALATGDVDTVAPLPELGDQLRAMLAEVTT